MRKIFLLSLFIALIAGVIFSSCTPNLAPTTQTPTVPTTPASTALTPKYGGTLRVIIAPAPANIGWPPEMVGTSGASNLAQYSLETLLRGDNKGNVVPWLAESYKVADDLKSITFNLRKGIKFHDGSDFNAEVAKWNLDNMINANLEPHWASVDLIDDYTIRVNFIDWMNTLPTTFAEGMTNAFIVSKVAYDKNGAEWMRGNPVGTGPFKFVSYTKDVGFKVVKNPDYWVKGKPYLDGIEYIFVADPTTQKIAMETGEGDYAGTQAKDAADYAAMGLKVDSRIDNNHCLIPDTANADSPWANKKVREAVEYAIDREAIATGLGHGFWKAVYQIPTRGSTPYDPDFTLGRKYDPEKAKQLLAEAGYPDGFKTTIIVAPFGMNVNRDLIIAVQADLAKVGIQANLDFPEIGRYVTYLFPATWPSNAAICAPLARLDPNFTGGIQFMSDIVGKSWLRTPEFTQAYKAALSSPTPNVKLIRVVTDLMTKEALVIPFCEGEIAIVTAPYVIAGYDERGFIAFWNSEEAWLNK